MKLDNPPSITKILEIHANLCVVYMTLAQLKSEQFFKKESAELARKREWGKHFNNSGKNTVKQCEVYANEKSEEARMQEIKEKETFSKQQDFLKSIDNAIGFCTMMESRIPKLEQRA